MVYRRFGVNFFFAICLFGVLEEAKMQTVTSSSGSSVTVDSSKTHYYTDINNGELGIRILYDSKVPRPRMDVTIYYDTEVKIASDFFQTQLIDQVFQDFTACGVAWNFMPCGTSKFDNTGVLFCPVGEDQCTFDKIHACVATMSAQDQTKIGQFVVCFFNNNKNVDLCLGKIGLNPADVNACAGPQGQGATQCNAFNARIHPNGSPTPPPGPSTGTVTTDVTTDFKGVLCGQFADVNLQCKTCPPPAPPSPPPTPSVFPPTVPPTVPPTFLPTSPPTSQPPPSPSG
ncbi:uncharacterized protein LOC135844161 [Planococcus citri]|uniref:uncharacterized protein LOC135844161 n=1 Tax=Planococcus citri TaxID=170843 RepID=UPI0031F9FAAF